MHEWKFHHLFPIFLRLFSKIYFHLHHIRLLIAKKKLCQHFIIPAQLFCELLWQTDKQMDRKTLKWTYKYYWMELFPFLAKWCFSFYGFSCGYNKLYFLQTNYPLLSKLTFTQKYPTPVRSRVTLLKCSKNFLCEEVNRSNSFLNM